MNAKKQVKYISVSDAEEGGSPTEKGWNPVNLVIQFKQNECW